MKTVFLTCSVLLFLSACATSSSQWKPENIQPDQGAFFGHIEISNKGDDVTSNCYAEFTDPADRRKVYISLDDTGWVFGSVPVGETYLSTVRCTVGGFFRRQVAYRSRDIKFNISGNNTISYFGHFSMKAEQDTGFHFLFLLGGAGAGVLAASGSSDSIKQVSIDDKTGVALQEFAKRYNSNKFPLTVKPTIASQPAAAGKL